MTARDRLKVPHDFQSIPGICLACEPEATTTLWPVLHSIARNHTHPTTHLPPQACALVAPCFHRTEANLTVAWNPDHALQWLFTTTPIWPPPDPAGVAISYSMYEPGRTGKHEHPYYPLHHSCHTTEHRTHTLTCGDLNQDTAHILQYIYSYLTQGQPHQGLIATSPGVKHIISKGVGVYAPPNPAAHNPGGPPHHGPRHKRLPAHEPMLPPTTIPGGPTLLHRRLRRIRPHAHHQGGHPRAKPQRGTLPHGPQTGQTTYGASSLGKLGAITKMAIHPRADLPHVVRV